MIHLVYKISYKENIYIISYKKEKRNKLKIFNKKSLLHFYQDTLLN